MTSIKLIPGRGGDFTITSTKLAPGPGGDLTKLSAKLALGPGGDLTKTSTELTPACRCYFPKGLRGPSVEAATSGQGCPDPIPYGSNPNPVPNKPPPGNLTREILVFALYNI